VCSLVVPKEFVDHPKSTKRVFIMVILPSKEITTFLNMAKRFPDIAMI